MDARRRVALALFGLSVIAATAAGGVARRAYMAEVDLFFPAARPLQLSLEDAGIPSLSQVELRSDRGTLRGWYAPTDNGATVVLCHGAGGDRTQLIDVARALASAGFGTLMFDWPGHGKSDGTISWRRNELESLDRVVTWLTARPEVDRERIGGVGFSMGGYVLTLFQANDARIKTAILMATPGDFSEQVRLTHQRWSWLRQPAARWALERHGVDLGAVQPVDLIGNFSPRPLLVVGGDQDYTVPLELTQRLFEAAKQPKQLYVVQGATHNDLARVGGKPFLDRIIGHLRDGLRPTSPNANRPRVE